MAVPKAKKPKKSDLRRPAETPLEISKLATYLSLAVHLRTVCLAEGRNDEAIANYMESYVVLMDEIAEGRTSVRQFIRDTKKLTGYDPEELLARYYK